MIIRIDGGLVSAVYMGVGPDRIVVHDYDNDGYDEDELELDEDGNRYYSYRPRVYAGWLPVGVRPVVIATGDLPFALSPAAVRLAREISGNSLWANISLPEELEEPKYYGGFSFDIEPLGCEVKRDDPVLVEVVRRLGEEAEWNTVGWNGNTVKGLRVGLKVVEIPDDVRYEIVMPDNGPEYIRELPETPLRVWH